VSEWYSFCFPPISLLFLLRQLGILLLLLLLLLRAPLELVAF
jgi:hypothetical protein